MGLTKEYLRYVHADNFNIISSVRCNVCFVVLDNKGGRHLATGACEDVIIWDLRLGEKTMVLKADSFTQVTQIATSPDNVHLAAGYADGSIRLFNLETQEVSCILNGHRSPITALSFDLLGHRLASGSKDTEIVTWDMISECGIERLSGHRGAITGLCFLRKYNIIISSSTDTYIKLWDLSTSHCFHTIAAYVTEIWTLSIIGEDEFIVVGSGDSELRVWAMLPTTENQHLVDPSNPILGDIVVEKVGSILRSGRGRSLSAAVDNSSRVLCVHGTDSTVELFSFLNEADARTKWKRRIAKERKKAAKLGEDTVKSEQSLKDRVARLPLIKCSAKVKSASVLQGKGELRVAVSLNNNKLELYSVSMTKDITENNEPQELRNISHGGHQGEVRAVAFSSDGLAIASVGTTQIKLWNRASLNCLRSIPCNYAVSVCFVPGDRHALVGLKEGNLLIVDLAAGEILEDIPAHTTELWSVVLHHDNSGALTGGGDNTVKEWKFELIPSENNKILSLQHTRTLKVDDSVLCVRVSPCGMYLAVALLDSTVRVYFLDTFKFFVSLYGHSMPVLCMDISFDSKLVVTGSADKNVKLWGLDFGDCHKSLFAHDDAVTSVAFVPETHYFFSIGKDGKIKQWDAGRFEKIITLDGHFGEGWCVSVTADHVVSCGQDRVLRLYSKTDEILVLSDEQEEERAKEEQLATGQDSLFSLPSTKTVTSEAGADLLIECLESIKVYNEDLAMDVKPTFPPMMMAYNVTRTHEYLAKVLSTIRPGELGEVLLLVPFHLVKEMLVSLKELLKSPLTTETAIKAMLLLVKVHRKPLENDSSVEGILESLEEVAFDSLNDFRDIVGVNVYGMSYIQRALEEREGIRLFYDASVKSKEKQKRKKRKEKANQAVILSL